MTDAAEDVAACVDEVGDRLGRLLQEREHPTSVVDGHATEGARIVDLGEVQRDGRVVRSVQRKLRTDVVPRQHVAVENQHRVGIAPRAAAKPRCGCRRRCPSARSR